MDTFEGLSPVTEYFVTITDGTGLFYNFTQNKTDETTCEPIPSSKQHLLSDDCGNLTLSIKSKNDAGTSNPFIFEMTSGKFKQRGLVLLSAITG